MTPEALPCSAKCGRRTRFDPSRYWTTTVARIPCSAWPGTLQYAS